MNVFLSTEGDKKEQQMELKSCCSPSTVGWADGAWEPWCFLPSACRTSMHDEGCICEWGASSPDRGLFLMGGGWMQHLHLLCSGSSQHLAGPTRLGKAAGQQPLFSPKRPLKCLKSWFRGSSLGGICLCSWNRSSPLQLCTKGVAFFVKRHKVKVWGVCCLQMLRNFY